MDGINNDKDVLDDGRETLLEKQEYFAPLRDQIVQKLFNKLEDKEIGKKVTDLWSQANDDRTAWLDRQAEYLTAYDEFIDVPQAGVFDSSSNLHVPITLWVLKSYHARFLQTLFNPEPSLSLKARKAAHAEVAQDLEDFVKYALTEWANNRQGIEEACDQWVWSWVASGIGYIKGRWDCKYHKYEDVIETQVPGPDRYITDSQGNEVAIPMLIIKEEVATKIEKTFEGPVLEFLPIEDVAVIGQDITDVTGADAVIHRQFLTASDLWTLVERKIFNKEAVEEVIEAGGDSESTSHGSIVKHQRQIHSGESSLDKNYDHERYEILEAYLSIDVDGTGINSEVIVWVHNRTKKLLRATYLHRMNKSGERPITAISFHKRSGTNKHMPIGLVEMLYPIQKEIDAIHNMRIDFGLISTVPFGFYRASSSLNPKELKLSPGALYPLDNPQTDVYFPQLGNRTSFGFQEEQALFTMVERLTGISDINLGAISGKQGVTRTATGVQATLSESNTNLNTPLKRLNRGWKKVLEYFVHMLQQRTPKGLEYRVLGDNGYTLYKKIMNPELLAGDFDIEVSPTTEASNKNIQINNATQILQLIQNPLLIQTGIVSPTNIYEGVKNYLKIIGVKDYSKFINSALEGQITLTPGEEVGRVLSGQNPPILPASDHSGVMALIQEIMNDDEKMGQLSPQQAAMLQAHSQKHASMAQAIQAQQAQQAASQQMQFNAQAGASQTSPGGNPLSTAATSSEGEY